MEDPQHIEEASYGGENENAVEGGATGSAQRMGDDDAALSSSPSPAQENNVQGTAVHMSPEKPDEQEYVVPPKPAKKRISYAATSVAHTDPQITRSRLIGQANVDSVGNPEVPDSYPAISTYRSAEKIKADIASNRSLKNLEATNIDFAALLKGHKQCEEEYYLENDKLIEFKKQAENPSFNMNLLFAQEQLVNRCWNKLQKVEKQRHAAELKQCRQVAVIAPTKSKVAYQHSTRREIARQRQHEEVNRANSRIECLEREERQYNDKQVADRKEFERKAKEAAKHQKIGAQRLAETMKVHSQEREVIEEYKEAEFDHRAGRLLGLKGSINDTKNKMQAANERKRKAQKKKEEEQDAEKEKLFSEGINAYEVWRRRDMEKIAEREQIAAAAKKQMRAEGLLKRMIVEDARKRVADKEAYEQKLVEAEFQREMNGMTMRNRMTEWMQKKTIGNV